MPGGWGASQNFSPVLLPKSRRLCTYVCVQTDDTSKVIISIRVQLASRSRIASNNFTRGTALIGGSCCYRNATQVHKLRITTAMARLEKNRARLKFWRAPRRPWHETCSFRILKSQDSAPQISSND